MSPSAPKRLCSSWQIRRNCPRAAKHVLPIVTHSDTIYGNCNGDGDGWGSIGIGMHSNVHVMHMQSVDIRSTSDPVSSRPELSLTWTIGSVRGLLLHSSAAYTLEMQLDPNGGSSCKRLGSQEFRTVQQSCCHLMTVSSPTSDFSLYIKNG